MADGSWADTSSIFHDPNLVGTTISFEFVEGADFNALKRDDLLGMGLTGNGFDIVGVMPAMGFQFVGELFSFDGNQLILTIGGNLDDYIQPDGSVLAPSIFSNVVGDYIQVGRGNAASWSVEVNGEISWLHSTINTYSMIGVLREELVNQVPEPSILAIFVLGMIGLASRQFKK